MVSKYELARIIGARALQLFYNAPPNIKNIKNEIDFIKISEKEYEENLIPLKVEKKDLKK